MSVSAIIVNYFTKDYLDILLEQLSSSPLISKIIVVDNSQELKQELDFCKIEKVELLVNNRNLGFGAAVNKAAKKVRSRWLLVVNPDVRLLPGCVQALVAAAEEFEAPVTGPRFYWDDDKRFRLPPATGQSWWFEAGLKVASIHTLERELVSFYWSLRHERFWKETSPFFEPFLSGACLLFDLKWLGEGLPVFDERFFLYFEDTDFCARALLANKNPMCVPEAEAIHYWNQAPGNDKLSLMNSAAQEYRNKHYPDNLPDITITPKDFFSCYDLGEITQGYIFHSGKVWAGEERYFEFGVSDLFVPFAQMIIKDAAAVFPAAVWNRLAPGEYCSRIRSSLYGTLKCWKWKKQ